MGQELETSGREGSGKVRLYLSLSSANPDIQYRTPENLLIITHIPRTAGTTLDIILRAVGGGRGHGYGRAMGTIYNQFLGSEKDDAADWIVSKQKLIPKLRYLIGHIPFGIHENFGLETATYGVVLRDPLIRLFSQIKLGYPDTAKIGAKEIEAVIREKKIIDNCQVRMIAGCFDADEPCDEEMLKRARVNLDKHYSYVGFQENFDQFLHQIVEGEQWPSVLYMSRHQSPYTEIVLPLETHERLEHFIGLDKVLYEEAKIKYRNSSLNLRTPIPADPDTVQESSKTDIVFHVKPHTLMGHHAGTIPNHLIPGILKRLKRNGLEIDIV